MALRLGPEELLRLRPVWRKDVGVTWDILGSFLFPYRGVYGGDMG